MPAEYTQTNRPLVLNTPLGKDVLLAFGITGSEAISQPFRFTLDAKTVRGTDVPFDKLIGQELSMALELPSKKYRYFSGICVRAVQGESNVTFTDYQFDIVPQFWLLTKKSQSKIFQGMTVPDILKEVLKGLRVEYQIQGQFEKRDYCVQYRETDFNFASRLMEEEGIYYFFKHEAGAHTMVLSNMPNGHPAVPGQTSILYKNVNQEAAQKEDHIYDLSKIQEQSSGKFLLWDHTFEMPHKHLEATKPITDSVTVGRVSHKLAVANSQLEIYDYPGEYAQRFDGIDTGGGEQAGELGKIQQDNVRTVNLRMQAEAANSISVRGASTARQLTSGHKFSVTTKPDDDVATPIKAEGEYVITRVTHAANLADTYRSGDRHDTGFRYDNTFVAIPSVLPFRPSRVTPKPVINGTQTAVVVGPPGEEIFTDKYGRIKVQFHWDRIGKTDPHSSCWIRVAQVSAGSHWGAFQLPRIGQEVIVGFQEGDPDQPICIGSVYNPEQMPKYTLPDHKTRTYIRTNSTMGGVGYNEIRFEDKADAEHIYVHAQKDMHQRVRNDNFERIGNNRHLRVGFYLPNDHKGDLGGESKKGSQFEEVAVDQHLKVHRHKDEHIGGDMKLLVGGIDGDGKVDIHIKDYKKELIDKTSDLHVKQAVKEKFDQTFDQHIIGAVKEKYDATYDQHITGAVKEKYDATYDLVVGGETKQKFGGSIGTTVNGDIKQKLSGNQHADIGQSYEAKTGQKYNVDAGQEIHLKGGMKVIIEAGMQISLKAAGGFINIGPSGVDIQGILVNINSGGSAGSGSGASPSSPSTPADAADAADAVDAADANPTKPTDAIHTETGEASNKPVQY